MSYFKSTTIVTQDIVAFIILRAFKNHYRFLVWIICGYFIDKNRYRPHTHNRHDHRQLARLVNCYVTEFFSWSSNDVTNIASISAAVVGVFLVINFIVIFLWKLSSHRFNFSWWVTSNSARYFPARQDYTWEY